MADELWDELQHLELGREDPVLFIPHEAYAAVEKRNRLSIIARPLNPRVQNLNAVVAGLPRSWGLTSRVHGRVLDATYVQFLFETEVDLLSVQRREPWLFNNWFVASQRWEVLPAVDFLTSTDLWVQMRGIPLVYVCEETAIEIAQEIAQIITLDYHDATSTQIAFIRVRVRITEHLRFFQRITFDSGESALISFQYERLRRICSSCFRLTHHRNFYPYRQPPVLIRNVEGHPPNGRDRVVLRDDLHRSDLNSQSLMSDNLIPAPRYHPPRVATPPLNPEELAAASPYFPRSKTTSVQSLATPLPKGSTRRHLPYLDSNITPSTCCEISSKATKVFEVGESSKRCEAGDSRNKIEKGDSSKGKNMEVLKKNNDERNMKKKGSEPNAGGILKPPKKRENTLLILSNFWAWLLVRNNEGSKKCQRLTHDKNRCSFKPETSAVKSVPSMKDKGKQKEMSVKDLSLFGPKPVASTFLVDANKGYANSIILAASRAQDDDLSDELPEIDILTGFNTGSCEANSSGDLELLAIKLEEANRNQSADTRPRGRVLPASPTRPRGRVTPAHTTRSPLDHTTRSPLDHTTRSPLDHTTRSPLDPPTRPHTRCQHSTTRSNSLNNMADEIWDELQHMDLGREEPTLFIPQEAYASVEGRNRLSLIARPLNPRVQNLKSVIAALPRLWGLTSHVHGRILDTTYVQVLFQFEVDMLSVQRKEPWLFNNWFVASQRWEPIPAMNFLTTIDLWVQMRGIPLLYVCEETAVEIASDLGEIISLDYHDATTTQIAYIRGRIRFGISDRLRCFQRITFDSGETALIQFQYERLRRICSSCFRFTHTRNFCPYRQRLHNFGRERAVFHDDLLRSGMNSQSQMTDNSFLSPMTPPPRFQTPPLNPEELAATSPYLPFARTYTFQYGAVSIPQEPSRRQQAFSDSNITPSSGAAIPSRTPRVFEVGESSRRGEVVGDVAGPSNTLASGESSKRKKKITE
ncbi:hypothetical protein ISN45_Aa02g011320 [Arabidopsis thaliana x Arabidopsis arenosa]|uniref:Ta11-like non-LTR retrotransposon n=1 Tax=Arabidopsis thaliana x Arabidopsis arenosa TaxID=1240361 RepID=A0A8T2BIQ1_9BRAS|nr:hypothetical protein ISN45_Aa02g011320 [Arabidopsis thaliana x Arabidopsis arenosa]